MNEVGIMQDVQDVDAQDPDQEDVVGKLFEALVYDGFTGYCFGSKADPHALIAVYEWPRHLDVITMHPDGSAAAARLEKPEGGIPIPEGEPHPFVLNPPGTAVWAYVGPMPFTMRALVRLPHPDDPDAPVAEVPVATPDALRLSRECQRPMAIRVPEQGRAGSRAARLSQSRPKVVMSEQFFNDLLDAVDSEHSIEFASFFTEGGVFRWGNFKVREGRTCITAFVQGFFSMIRSVEHDIEDYWQVDDRRAVTHGVVTFTTHTGESMTVPFLTLARFTADGTLMESYQVCLDPSPLVGVTIPGSEKDSQP
jgi:SnoaL-like protein